jgi:hypothetical protein
MFEELLLLFKKNSKIIIEKINIIIGIIKNLIII